MSQNFDKKEERERMEKTIQMTVKVAPSTYKSLQKLAAKRNQTMSAVVRQFIDKGMEIQGYRNELDFITGIMRQEIKAEVGAQAHRLASMMFKIGTISSSNYFLAVRILADVINPSMQEDFKDINSRARQLGEEFMSMKYSEYKSFWENDESIEEAASRIRAYWGNEY